MRRSPVHRPTAFRTSAHSPPPPDTVELCWRITVDRHHPYLAARGYHQWFVQELELGVSTDRLKGRLVIPVRNARGNVTGYIGRWTGDPVPSSREKYRYAGSAEAEVLNLPAVIALRTELPIIVVTDPLDFLHLRLNGREGVVSLVGDEINDVQLRRLTYHFPGHPFIVLCDETKRGRQLRKQLVERLGGFNPVKTPEFLTAGRTVQSLTREEAMEEL